MKDFSKKNQTLNQLVIISLKNIKEKLKKKLSEYSKKTKKTKN